MFTRFGIALTRLDSQGIASLNRMLPSTVNPFMFHDRVIVSMDTLKNDRYLSALEKCHWDTVAIDECHNVSVKGGNLKNQRARLARTLCEQAEAVILSSATPHDGTMEGFASLIKLLDPTSIKDETSYHYDDIKHLFIRRTKDTVKEELRYGEERKNILTKFPLSSNEEQVLESLNNLNLKEDLKSKTKKRVNGAGHRELFRTTLIKAYLSSPYALAETINNKIKRSKNLMSEDRAELDKILKLVEKTFNKNFTKFNKLEDLVQKLPKAKKMVIFTERIATLNFLEEKLKKYGEVLKMNGSMPDSDLMDTASRFQSGKDKAKFLVATNVASEGLNLHHSCHHLLHFDLPWSFITLEQRNGRIDRIGQKYTPHLYYMCAESGDPKIKADLHITEKLSSRIEKAGNSMDDPSLEAGFLTGEQEIEQMTMDFEEEKFGVKAEVRTDSNYLTEFLTKTEDNIDSPKDKYSDSTKELESFYSNDYDYIKEALVHLDIEHDAKKEEIIVPLDRSLRFELEEAPKEVIASDKIKLQFSNKKMEKEIEDCIRFNEWPTSQWASNHHPLQELIRRRCLDLFPGDETPVVFYKGKNNEHKVGILMQGISYNKHGQILFEEWAVCTFKNMFGKDTEPYGPYNISEIKKWTGLDKKNVANPKEKITPRMEEKLLEKASVASEWMKDVMATLRKERGEKKGPKVRAERARLEKWAKERRVSLKRHIDELKSDSSVGSNFKKSDLETELNSIEKITNDYGEWVSDYYSTNKNPVVKIVGVFINAGKK